MIDIYFRRCFVVLSIFFKPNAHLLPDRSNRTQESTIYLPLFRMSDDETHLHERKSRRKGQKMCYKRKRKKMSQSRNPNGGDRIQHNNHQQHQPIRPLRPRQQVPANYIDVDDDVLQEVLGGPRLFRKPHILRRRLIGDLFHYKYQLTTDKKQWDRIAGEIRDILDIPKGTKIKHIFQSVLNARADNVDWDPETSLGYSECGRNPIADAVEKGNGRKVAQLIVNMYQEANDLHALTEASVYSCIKRMKPCLRNICLRQQGSKDTVESPGALSRYYFSLHMLLRFQIPGSAELLQEFIKRQIRSRLATGITGKP